MSRKTGKSNCNAKNKKQKATPTYDFEDASPTLLRSFRHVWVYSYNKFMQEQYLRRYEDKIDAAGRLLEYLGLAMKDTTFEFDLAPTDILLDVIDNKEARPKNLKEGAPTTQLAVTALLADAVFGEGESKFSHSARDFGFRVLEAFGLLQRTAQEEWLPTTSLYELLEQRRYYDLD
jgi:hypothetical protein